MARAASTESSLPDLLAEHFPGPLHHRRTILSALGLSFPHGFVFGNSRATSQWVTHHGSALATFSLNFRVPTELKASELSKCLVLGRDENIHLRITPMGDVGCYNPPPLGARRPCWHTSGQGLALIPICHIPARGGTLPRPAPPPFVFGISRATFQWVTHHGSALATFSLNFRVPTELEANELPKDFVLGRDENIHSRITPLGDITSYSSTNHYVYIPALSANGM
ncbi:unnamed protein product [Malus baccata var. baccata]